MTKVALRKTWFQVHKWIGLILAVLIVPLSLSGALLVWDDAFDHVLNPARYAVSGRGSVDPARYVAAARAALRPGDVLTAVTLPHDGAPAIVAASRPGASVSGPPRVTVYLDPPTARVLAVANNRSGLLATAHMLHGNLLIPGGVGRQVVGGLGVAMLLSSATGLWLWWPLVGTVRRGLRWRRQRGTDANLHYRLGFWIALPLFVLSLTGVWISFPQAFGGGMGPTGMRPGAPRPTPLTNPKRDIDGAIASAQALLPGDVAKVEWPTDRAPDWHVTIGRRMVTVADAGAAVVAAPPARETLARTMRRIHDGTRMGLVWQIVLFLGGLIPAVLAVTGIVMWWRARAWRAQAAARMA